MNSDKILGKIEMSSSCVSHYENFSMQYTDFFSCFTRKKNDIFNMFARSYTLEPPAVAILKSTHNLYFGPIIRKIGIPL